MSNKVPSVISKEDFENKILTKLHKGTFKKFERLIKENYKCPPNGTVYTLKENLSNELLNKLDFVFKGIKFTPFINLQEIARYFRMLLDEKKYIILFAYNGTGKTRLSGEFKSLGQSKINEEGEKSSDTLYYNAFTEDLFYWDNDLNEDTQRLLKFNSDSKFFKGLKELEMESRIRPLLHRYADFDFSIDYENFFIQFSRNTQDSIISIDSIKISRGEQNIFIWCFFLSIVQLVVDKEDAYNWVKYIYVDDPISSLDDNNVISVASHLAQLMRKNDYLKIIVSTHHTLFFNVLCNEIDKAEQIFLQQDTVAGTYILKDTRKTPFFQHVALLKELNRVADSEQLFTYHFNILRSILEKTASFHGFAHFSSCLRTGEDEDSLVHKRILDILSHGNYSLFDPKEMIPENKEYFKRILKNFLEDYKFNPQLLREAEVLEEQND